MNHQYPPPPSLAGNAAPPPPPQWYGRQPGYPSYTAPSPPPVPMGSYMPPSQQLPMGSNTFNQQQPRPWMYQPTQYQPPFQMAHPQSQSVLAPPSVMKQPPSQDCNLQEPPLLDELGIYPEDIWKRVKSVILFRSLEQELLADCDMSGPVLIFVMLGLCLMFAGKLHFSYVYALGSFGCLGLFVLLNLMSRVRALPFNDDL